MIKVLLGDATPLLYDSVFSTFIKGLDDEVRTRILAPKRAEHRACRLMAHLMLDALYRSMYSLPVPQVFISDLGKPHLEKGPAISVSHDKLSVAIGLTEDYKELGIDLQSQPNPVTESRVRRRFLTPPPPYRKGAPELDFLMAHIEGNRVDITPTHAYGTPSTFLCNFVRAEAIMKMTGGGFADFPQLHALCETCETAILPMDDVAIGLAYR